MSATIPEPFASDPRFASWRAGMPARQADLPACMGGFCHHRDHCGRHLTEHRHHVVERLCARGQEAPEPVRIAEPDHAEPQHDAA